MAAETRAAAERARQAVPRVITSSDARKTAMDLEAEGRNQDALRMYIGAARGGNCEAAARLGEIYDKGLAGVTRNYAESLKWYNAARVLGCEVPLSRVKPPAVTSD
jgi:TPR repeat protein